MSIIFCPLTIIAFLAFSLKDIKKSSELSMKKLLQNLFSFDSIYAWGFLLLSILSLYIYYYSIKKIKKIKKQ